jgi:hypothetical protein
MLNWTLQNEGRTGPTSNIKERTVRGFVESMMVQLNVECDTNIDIAEIVVLGMANHVRQEN